eukprot:2009852-Lingulodinium_polyedra.AAC.1
MRSTGACGNAQTGSPAAHEAVPQGHRRTPRTRAMAAVFARQPRTPAAATRTLMGPGNPLNTAHSA